jgi:hypothetical protein
MLAVERGASLVFRAHNPLKRCKVQLAKRIVLITEQTLSSSTVFNRLGPNVAFLERRGRETHKVPLSKLIHGSGRKARRLQAKGLCLFKSQHYRAKAIECSELVKSSTTAEESHGFQQLVDRFASLADKNVVIR